MPDSLVLVVEDDKTLQLLMKLSLNKLGYNCAVVGTGEEAVNFDLRQVSVILMDIGLPGIQGLEATEQIRSREAVEARHQVPIVAVTCHAIKEQCFSSGMDDFLQKPVLLQDLGNMLEKWIGRSAGEISCEPANVKHFAISTKLSR